MKVRVKLAAWAGPPVRGLGPDGEGVWDLAESATLADALSRIDTAGEELSLTLVNEELVRPARRAGHRLRDGDVLLVMPLVDGG